eukprot:850752_1
MDALGWYSTGYRAVARTLVCQIMLARRYARSKKKREEEMENDKKCVLQYLNGNDILDDSNELYANVLGLGMRELLQTRHVYKDTLFKELLESWSTECSIPMQH